MKIRSQEHQQKPNCHPSVSNKCVGNGIYGQDIEELSKRWMYPASGRITGFLKIWDFKLYVKLIDSCCFIVCLNVKVGTIVERLQRSREK